MKTISELVGETINEYSNRIAINYKREYLTYNDLDRKIAQFSHILLENDINYQDRVAIFLPNNPSFIISFFAIVKIRASAVAFNINYKKDELRNYLKFCRIKYIIFDKQNEDKCKSAIQNSSVKFISIDNSSLAIKSDRKLYKKINIELASKDEVLYQLSSGSIGKPKVIIRNHFNLLSEVKSISETLKILGNDKIFCVAPLSHAYAFVPAMMTSVCLGATIVLVDNLNPRRILDTLQQKKVTIFYAFPYVLDSLSRIPFIGKVNLPNLRFCFSAGISLPAEVAKRFYTRFGLYPRNFYGTSETGCISINLNENIETALDSVGLPLNCTKVKIMLENGKIAEAGKIGEIIIKTPTCGRWYYIGNNKKKSLLKNGFFYTGDIGKIDKKGNLYILGRNPSFINVAGAKVDPKEVEEVLKGYPGIKEVVVIGFLDRLRGEAVKAIIVSEGKASDKKSILKYCRIKISDFKVPRVIEFRNKLPKSALGKILKDYV